MTACKYSGRTIVAVVLLTAVVALGQSDRGTVTGTVADPSNAVVAAAKVTLRNTDTGTSSETITTATGNYTLTSLPVGEYQLTIEAPGFKTSTRSGLRVQVAQTIRVDIVLQVGDTAESVTVSAEAPMLKTENAEQSMNISGDRFNALPLNFGGGGGSLGAIRSWTAFIVLAPGVTGSGTGARVNGVPGENFKIILEGQDITSANHTGFTSTMTQTSVDMIEEFSLQTSNFAAEFGQVGGGLFNFTTRSGTNRFHGTAYEYLSNEALDSSHPFTHAKQISRKNDFGGTFGGPVWIPRIYNGHNKTFFFASYEGFRNRTLALGNLATLPTDAYRQGDFSKALTGRNLGTDSLGRPIMENTIYDPLTSRVVGGQILRDPFPGNQIPANRFDPVAVKVQGLLPNPSNPEIVQNWLQELPNQRIQSIPSVKIDHTIDEKNKLSFYLSKQTAHTLPSTDGLPVPITGGRDSIIWSMTSRLNYDRSLSPTTLLHLGAGYIRFHNPDSAPQEVLNYDAVNGIGFRGSATDPSGFPRIAGLNHAQGGLSLGLGPTNANKYYNDKFTSVASMTHIRGNHTYKFGGEFRIDTWTDRNSRGSQGILNFNAAQTGLPSTLGQLSGGNVGFPYASFLLGLVDNASVNAVQDPQWRKSTWAFYAQDTWKATRRLTLDYGLRWDYMTQGHEIFYRNSMFGPTIPNPSAGGLPGAVVYEGYGKGRCDCEFTTPYPYAIGPRLGAAYQLSQRTVIRAGVGVTYNNLPVYQYFTNAPILGVGFDQKVWDNPGFGNPAVVLRDGLQYSIGELYTPTLDPGLRPSPGQLNAPAQLMDRNGARPGRILQWNISLQQELGRNLAIEAAYVGNRGVWMLAPLLVAPNAIADEQFRAAGLDLSNAADRTLLTSRIDSPLAQSRGFRAPYAGFPGSATVAQTLRPFPQFANDLTPRWAPLGSTWYDSLQVKLTKRYSHGLDFTTAFTWQKDLALGAHSAAGGTGGPPTNDAFNRQNQKTIAASSQPFVFVIGFNYQVPGFGTSKIVRGILSDWTVGGILRYSSGTPITVPASQNNLGSLRFQNTRMNRVPGEPLYLQDLNCGCIDPNKELVLNPKAWANPAPGEWGYAPGFYNDYRTARRPDEQFSFGRVFPIKERMNFSVRAEFFNAFNRTFLNAPDSANPLTTPTFNSQGVPTAGFGRINANSSGTPRNGQIVARFQW